MRRIYFPKSDELYDCYRWTPAIIPYVRWVLLTLLAFASMIGFGVVCCVWYDMRSHYISVTYYGMKDGDWNYDFDPWGLRYRRLDIKTTSTSSQFDTRVVH